MRRLTADAVSWSFRAARVKSPCSAARTKASMFESQGIDARSAQMMFTDLGRIPP